MILTIIKIHHANVLDTCWSLSFHQFLLCLPSNSKWLLWSCLMRVKHVWNLRILTTRIDWISSSLSIVLTMDTTSSWPLHHLLMILSLINEHFLSHTPMICLQLGISSKLTSISIFRCAFCSWLSCPINFSTNSPWASITIDHSRKACSWSSSHHIWMHLNAHFVGPNKSLWGTCVYCALNSIILTSGQLNRLSNILCRKIQVVHLRLHETSLT